MKTLVLAAGRFGTDMQERVARGREPRLDVFEIARVLGAEVIDYLAVETSTDPAVPAIARTLGMSAATAYLGFRRRHAFDAVLTTGEDIGIPFSMLLKAGGGACSHTMIAHTLFPLKKRLLLQLSRAHERIDHILVYSTSEEQNATQRLGIPASKLQRIHFHADEQFFKPDGRPLEPDLICAAGQLLRDYDTLVEAVSAVPVRLQIAAGSPWIERRLQPKRQLPPNVTWGKLDRFELRELYARSALAVVPILQNEYQTGIATILEMMAMGKCVIATRTRGQTDTIIDGETGVYVPPSDPAALRRAIERLLADPAEARRIGERARNFIERQAGLDHFVRTLVEAVHTGHKARQSSRAR